MPEDKNDLNMPESSDETPHEYPQEFTELNQMREGEEGDDSLELTSPQIRAKLAIKIIAALTALIFIFIVLANMLHLFTWPSLDFLKESRDLSEDPALQELQQSVVQVLYVSQDGSSLPVAQRKGTGFNIHPSGLIVTNRHVVEGADAITVSFEEGSTYMASHWSKSSKLDLALVSLDLEENDETDSDAPLRELPYVELQMQRLPEIGEEVIIMGNPLGFRRVISPGTVSAYHPISELPYPVLEIEAPIHAGSSGSPVFDSEHKAVAVIYASLRQDTQDNADSIKGLAIPVIYLIELLEETSQ